MQWYEVVVGLIVACGGLGAAAQAIKALADMRAGVQQRAGVPTQKLVAYLEQQVATLTDRVTDLEAERDSTGAYVSELVYTMASAGIPVPMRPKT
jgi:hypothetical protein